VICPTCSVDFGGTGVKAAPVDITTGELVAERFRIPTPQPATPQAIAGVVKELAEHFEVSEKPQVWAW
jgi:polyphosphate glucokinase